MIFQVGSEPTVPPPSGSTHDCHSCYLEILQTVKWNNSQIALKLDGRQQSYREIHNSKIQSGLMATIVLYSLSWSVWSAVTQWVECLTQDRGIAGSNFGTGLCPWARHFILCWFNTGRPVPTLLKKCSLGRKESGPLGPLVVFIKLVIKKNKTVICCKFQLMDLRVQTSR